MRGGEAYARRPSLCRAARQPQDLVALGEPETNQKLGAQCSQFRRLGPAGRRIAPSNTPLSTAPPRSGYSPELRVRDREAAVPRYRRPRVTAKCTLAAPSARSADPSLPDYPLPHGLRRVCAAFAACIPARIMRMFNTRLLRVQSAPAKASDAIALRGRSVRYRTFAAPIARGVDRQLHR